jgi:hypothetical protein
VQMVLVRLPLAGMLEHGVYASITDLAAAEQINQSYVCRVLRLTLLGPNLVETILDGRHPSRLQLRTLLKPFPSDWTAQAVLACGDAES